MRTESLRLRSRELTRSLGVSRCCQMMQTGSRRFSARHGGGYHHSCVGGGERIRPQWGVPNLDHGRFKARSAGGTQQSFGGSASSPPASNTSYVLVVEPSM